MRNTLIALALLTASGYASARQIALYDQNPEWTAALKTALSTPRDTVTVLDAQALSQSDSLLAADLLVIPEPKRIPATAASALRAFVNARKSVLFLGPRPFSSPLYKIGNEWLTQDEQKIKRAQVPSSPVTLPQNSDAWRLSMRDYNIASSFAVEGSNAVHYKLDVMAGWTTYTASCQGMFPKGHNLLCFNIKGNASVHSMSIEFIENDHSRWIATVPVTTDWQRLALSPQDFHFWHDCKPTKPRGTKGDMVNFAEVNAIAIGLADTHTPGNGGNNLAFDLKDIGTGVNLFPTNQETTEPFPYLETFYPAYKQFPITGRPGCFSTMNRFQGSGYKQKQSWRYRPLKCVDGKLAAETDSRVVSPIWMIHYLDGTLAGTRIATYAVPVDINDATYLQTVKLLSARLQQPVELVAGGAHYFGMFPDQTDTVGTELEQFAPMPDADIMVETTIAPKNGGAKELERRTRPDFNYKNTWNEETVWKPQQADTDYVIKVRLMVDNVEWDSLTQEVYVAIPREQHRANTQGFITVKGSNFMLNGKPWYPVGVNFWTSNSAGTEWRKYMQGFLAPGFYDPKQIEKDLSAMESVGINMLSVQLLGDTGKEDTLRNLIDFFHRCRNHNMFVNGFLKPATPFAFDDERVKSVMQDGELAHFSELFAYDLCWEPGNYAFNAKSRPAYDTRWNAWLTNRYGSVENAIKDWQFEPNRTASGAIASPTDMQFSKDGDWRIYVAAYRRFMDDVTSQMWNEATRKMRALAPKQLMSFRQGNTLPHDFALTGPVKHLDFICPEGYSIPNSEDGFNAAAFITRYVHFTTGGKPIIWAEFGKSIWNANTVDISDSALKTCTAYHDLFYRMVLDSGANGTAPWWWSGWFRVGENSDYGIAGPDGVPRPMATMLKTYGPRLKTPRDYPEGDSPFVVDRDAHAGGYWYMAFNTGRDAYKAAREQHRHLKLVTPATGKTSADVPLTAIGNVPCNGTNPPKYLNAEFNNVTLLMPDGNRIRLKNGSEIAVPPNTPVMGTVSIGNLGEASWKASDGNAVKTGDVVLTDGDRRFTLTADVPQFGDAEWQTIELASAADGTRTITLRLSAAGRTDFGEAFRFTIIRK